MVTNRKTVGRAVSMPAGIGLGTAISLGITLAGSAIMAWMLSGEMMPMSMLGYGIMGMLLVSSFVGSMVSAGVIKRRRLFVCLTHGGLYLASLLLINGLFFGGEITGVVPTALLLGGGVGAAALVGLRQPGLVRRRNIKRRTG